MKIIIIGYSGSGKSTLAKILGDHYNIPVLHMDSIHFKPGWETRNLEEFDSIVKEFMDNNVSWIIDGNYHRVAKERFSKADQLIFLNYNPLTCLKNVIKRYKFYKHKTRPDMAFGCEEKIDFEFIKWVIYKGRTKERKERLNSYALNHHNALIFKNRRQLNNYLKENNIKYEIQKCL